MKRILNVLIAAFVLTLVPARLVVLGTLKPH